MAGLTFNKQLIGNPENEMKANFQAQSIILHTLVQMIIAVNRHEYVPSANIPGNPICHILLVRHYHHLFPMQGHRYTERLSNSLMLIVDEWQNPDMI